MAENQNIIITVSGRDKASGPIGNSTKSVKQLDTSVKSLQSGIIRLVGAIASLAAATAALSFPVREAIAFEKAMTEVAKTTGFSAESIRVLSISLRELSKETGVAATDLALIAARAGQLGLGRQGQAAIQAFTDTIARFAVVADLSVDQASTSIAKITNLFRIPIDQAEQVSATFNELSNTTVATAENLVDVVRRVGSAGGLLDFAEAAALAAQALELGQTPEVAGTALIKTFSNAAIKAKDFAKVVGITTEEWTENLKKNGFEAIKGVAQAISELDTLAQGEAIKNLFGGGRQFAFGQRIVEDAANGFKILNRTVKDSRNAFLLGTSALDEYERISRSTSRQIDILKQQFIDLAISAGDVFLPAINQAVAALKEFANDPETLARVKELAERTLLLAEGIISVGRAIALVTPDVEVLISLFGLLLGSGILNSLSKLLFGFGALKAVSGGFAESLTKNKGVVGKTAAAFAFLGGKQVALASKTQKATKQLGVFRKAIAFLFSPITKLVGLLGTLFAFLGVGPAGIGVAIVAGLGLAIASFSSDFRNLITDLFSSITGKSVEAIKKVSKESRDARVAAFQEATQGDGGLEIQKVSLTAVGTGVGALDAQFANAITLAGKFNEAILGGKQSTDELSAAWANVFAAQTNVKAEIRLIREEQKKLQKDLEEAQALSQEGSQFRSFREEEIRIATEGLKKTGTQLDALNDKLESLQGRETSIKKIRQDSLKATSDLAIKREQQAAQLLPILTKQQQLTFKGFVEFQKQKSRLNAAQKESLRLEQEIVAGVFKESDRDLLGQVGGLVTELTPIVAEMEKNFGDASITVGEFGEKGAEKVAELRKQIGDKSISAAIKLTDSAFKNLLETLDKGSDLEVAEALREARTELQQKLIRKEFIDSQLDDLKRLKDGVDSVAKGIKGVIDNLAASQRATLSNVSRIVAGFQEAFDDRKINLRLQFEEKEIEDEVSKKLKRINNIIDADVQRVQRSGISQTVKEGFIENLERRRVKLIELAEQEEKDLKVRTQFEGLVRKEAAALNRLNESEQRAVALGVELSESRGISPEEVTAQKQLQKESLALLKVIDDLGSSYENAVKERATFAGSVGKVDFLSGTDTASKLGLDFVAAQSSAQDAEEALFKVTTNRLAIQADLANKTEESSKHSVSTADALNLASNESKQLAEEIEKLRTNTGLAKIDFDAMASDALTIVSTFNNSDIVKSMNLEEAKTSMAQILDLVATTTETRIAAQQANVGGVVDPILFRQIKEGLRASRETVIEEVSEGVFEGYKKGTRDSQELINRNFSLDDGSVGLEGSLKVDQDSIEQAAPVVIDAKINIVGTTVDGVATFAQGRADGGYISGAGTGTSDSIPAMLSNGEYVMDAHTTGRFGASFFKSIQNMARNGVGLPRFAAGGPVFSSNALPAFAGEGVRDVIDVNFNLPGGSFRLNGERSEVDRMKSALASLTRGNQRG